MTHLLIVILDDLTCMPDLLQTWRTIGVPGTTILESVGAYRVGTWLSRVGIRDIDLLFEDKELRRRTLFAAIEDDEILAQAEAFEKEGGLAAKMIIID